MLNGKKKQLALSSAILLAPMVFGLAVWNRLPQTMVTHWGIDGTPNGWSSRGFVVFVLPLIMLAIHWIALLFSAKDLRNRGQDPKVLQLVLWITPAVSVFAFGCTYVAALGAEFNIGALASVVVGVLFIAVGNYLPKCRQNYAIGIRVKWTLKSEENWNATHRMAGRLWVVGGVLAVLCAFLPMHWMSRVFFCVVILLSVIPIVYSWQYHKKMEQQ